MLFIPTFPLQVEQLDDCLADREAELRELRARVSINCQLRERIEQLEAQLRHAEAAEAADAEAAACDGSQERLKTAAGAGTEASSLDGAEQPLGAGEVGVAGSGGKNKRACKQARAKRQQQQPGSRVRRSPALAPLRVLLWLSTRAALLGGVGAAAVAASRTHVGTKAVDTMAAWLPAQAGMRTRVRGEDGGGLEEAEPPAVIV